MGFPNIFKNNKIQNNAPTGWENMANQNQDRGQTREANAETQLTPEQQDIRRQQNKLIAYFLTDDINQMRSHDVEITQAAEEYYFEHVLDGRITKQKEDNLLKSIASPIDSRMRNGQTREDAFRDVSNELGVMNNFIIGRAISTATNDAPGYEKNLQTFAGLFPLPSDFDETESSLRQSLEAEGKLSNRQIDESLRTIRKSLYGKRQAYQDRINELHSAAQDYAIQKNLRWQQGAEVERNPGFSVGSFGISKAELKAGQTISFAGEASQNYESYSQDSYYIDKESGTFAVFDGVGGSELGMAASRACRDAMPSQNIHSVDDIVTTMTVINSAVCNACGNVNPNQPPRGATTATIVKLSEDHRTLSCVSVGDSRAYLVRNGKAELLTKDDGEGNKISKFIGDPSFHVGKITRENIITRNVMQGDHILICSDGITGDYEPDLMKNETIANVVSMNTPEDAARFLTQIATKTDDRTAIVIEV